MAFKYLQPQSFAEDREYPDAEDPEVEAVAEGHGDPVRDAGGVSGRLVSGGRRQQDHSQRVYESGGKEDKRHCHAGESPICTDSLGPCEAVDSEPLRDHDRLGTL